MANKFFVDGMTVEQILSMDPAQMAKLNKRDISRALRTVSLAANKRLEKLNDDFLKRVFESAVVT